MRQRYAGRFDIWLCVRTWGPHPPTAANRTHEVVDSTTDRCTRVRAGRASAFWSWHHHWTDQWTRPRRNLSERPRRVSRLVHDRVLTSFWAVRPTDLSETLLRTWFVSSSFLASQETMLQQHVSACGRRAESGKTPAPSNRSAMTEPGPRLWRRWARRESSPSSSWGGVPHLWHS